MRIVMIGEAAKHQDKLAAALPDPLDIIALPAEAGTVSDFDSEIGGEDIVISMRFERKSATAPAFGLLHLPGAGLDGIDLAVVRSSTWVCNVYEHEQPIAEYVLLAMLRWVIDLDGMRARFSPETWSSSYRARVPHGELAGRTVGLIGYGHVGQLIARKASALDMRVIALRRGPGVPDAYLDRIYTPAELPELLAQSDFVVVCCPLTGETRAMIGAAELAEMKSTAVIINIARAEIIDERALFEALDTKCIAGAYLDVWYRYPRGADDTVAPSEFPFHRLPNVVCTPHSSAWTTDLPARRYTAIARNIQRYRRGEPLENVVRAATEPAPEPLAPGA